MNKYIKLKGSNIPFLLLETAEDVDNSFVGVGTQIAHSNEVVDAIEKGTAEEATGFDMLSARMTLLNHAFLARSGASDKFANGSIYKEAIEKYGEAVIVNPKGGYQFLPSADQIAEQWEAETVEGAIV